jgi:hypothetical protein
MWEGKRTEAEDADSGEEGSKGEAREGSRDNKVCKITGKPVDFRENQFFLVYQKSIGLNSKRSKVGGEDCKKIVIKKIFCEKKS